MRTATINTTKTEVKSLPCRLTAEEQRQRGVTLAEFVEKHSECGSVINGVGEDAPDLKMMSEEQARADGRLCTYCFPETAKVKQSGSHFEDVAGVGTLPGLELA